MQVLLIFKPIIIILKAGPKKSPLDVCIEEGNNGNVVNINQNQPIQSELTRTSSSCILSENTNAIPVSNPDPQSSSIAPPTTPNIQTTLSSTSIPTSATTKSTSDTTKSTTGSIPDDDSQS